jgi:hypothetical protein
VFDESARLHERADLHVALVGHTGKDESKGSRGSNAHPADADLQVQIFGDAIKTVNVIKGNDQPEAELTTFKLEAAELGIDEDGDPITTAILSEQMFEAQARAPKRKLSDRQKLALGALTEVVLARGTHPPPAWQLPNGVQIVAASSACSIPKRLTRARISNASANPAPPGN